MGNSAIQNLECTQGSIINLSIAAVAVFLLPIAYTVLWKRHCGKAVSFAPLFIGAAGFIVSARILELGVHMLCVVLDNPVSRFINGSTPAYVIYGVCMAGIFEECGRYIIIKYLMKKNKTKENFVMYGIGHGGIEVWTITLVSLISLLAIAVIIRYQGAESALQFIGVSEDAAENLVGSAVSTMTAATNFSPVTAVLYVFERICAMTVHIAFTVIVAYGVVNGQKKYLFVAILAHGIIDVFPALYQRGAVSMAAMEIWMFVWAIVIFMISVMLYRSFAGREIDTDDLAEA